MYEWLCLSVGVPRAVLRSQCDLALEYLLLRQQVAVALRSRPRPRLRPRDRLFWAPIQRCCAVWRRHLVLVQPATVLRWHREAWRLVWWWRPRRPISRPRVPREVRALIATLSRHNPLWGSERIRGELRKLGVAVSNRSIRRYRWHGPGRPRSQTWRTFLRHHAHAIWAADLLTVQTLTFRTLYVLLFITHGRRELVHLAVTAPGQRHRRVRDRHPPARLPRPPAPVRRAASADDFRRVRRLRQHRAAAGPPAHWGFPLSPVAPILGWRHHVYERAA